MEATRKQTGVMGRWGKEINLEELNALSVPSSMGARHYPIALKDQVQVIKDVAKAREYTTNDWHLYLDNEGQKLLATWTLDSSENNWINTYRPGHSVTGFVIASTNQKVSTVVGAGDYCWLCANGMIQADHMFRRKSTEHALEDIRNNMWDLMDSLKRIAETMTNDWNRWDNYDLSSKTEASHVLIKAADNGVINWRDIPHVRQHWLEPEHEEFKGRNLSNMVQAFTSHQRDKSPFVMTNFSKRLRDFVNHHCFHSHYLDHPEGVVNGVSDTTTS